MRLAEGVIWKHGGAVAKRGNERASGPQCWKMTEGARPTLCDAGVHR